MFRAVASAIHRLSRYEPALSRPRPGRLAAAGVVVAAAAVSSRTESRAECARPNPPLQPLDIPDDVRIIVAGGGTGGCVFAWLAARWLSASGLLGSVLLLERGPDHSPDEGPSPAMHSWFSNWGSFGVSHEALWGDGSGAHPAPASDHVGLGGCGTHDTRITFAPTPAQLAAYDTAMGWSPGTSAAFVQVALDMTPLSHAAGPGGEPFFDAFLAGLRQTATLGGGVDGGIAAGSSDLNAHVPASGGAGYVAAAMWPGEETRWSSALLLDPAVRPANLHVHTGVTAVRVLWERGPASVGEGGAASQLRAGGFEVDTGAGGRRFVACTHGSRASTALASGNDGPACEYVLMAGALGVPALLQRSGVGDPSLLARLGVPVVAALPGVGRGVDHAEVPLVWALPDAWATSGPVALFAPLGHHAPGAARDTLSMAHVGIAAHPCERVAGVAARPISRAMRLPPSPRTLADTDRPALVVTPNVTEPDPSTGFSVEAVSGTDPAAGVRVIHVRDARGRSALAAGARAVAAAVGPLEAAGIVGPLLSPPPALLRRPPPEHQLLQQSRLDSGTAATGASTADTHDPLQAWAEEAQGTAFHWLGTARAGADPGSGVVCREQGNDGISGAPPPVLNGNFQLRDGSGAAGGCVPNLRVGSAACLPFAPVANPHLTISAFAAALASAVVSDSVATARSGVAAPVLPELAAARATVARMGGAVVPRRAGEERPDLRAVARTYRKQWEARHTAESE